MHHGFLEAGGLLIAMTVILMGNTTPVVKWQSIMTVKIFLFTLVFNGYQMDLMEILILWYLQK